MYDGRQVGGIYVATFGLELMVFLYPGDFGLGGFELGGILS